LKISGISPFDGVSAVMFMVQDAFNVTRNSSHTEAPSRSGQTLSIDIGWQPFIWR
jgi:hypothetical protein